MTDTATFVTRAMERGCSIETLRCMGVQATSAVGGTRPPAPAGTAWYASDAQIRRDTCDRLELGARVMEVFR